MTKNPLVNALSASGYILIIVTIFNLLSHNLRNKPDTFGAPLTMLSLFTLSAAVMAFIFLYQPVQLFIEGKKKQAVNLFIRTVGIFAVFTALVLVLLLSGVI